MQMLIKKGKETFDISQLSQGEKPLITLIGDFARRLAILNHRLSNPLEGYGIVLIDEIDLHLHPRWQRSVVRNLRRAFPNCQFLLTTHSPFVVTDPEKVRVFGIDKNEIEAISNPYGMDIEDFILENMNTPLRNEELQEKLDSLFRAIDNKDYELYFSIKNDLLNVISPENRELIRAQLYYKRQRAINEKNK